MKRILVYYKLTLLDSILVSITTICSIVMLINELISLKLSSFTIILGVISIILPLVFLILDVALISSCREIEEYYNITAKPKTRRSKKLHNTIQNITYFYSLVIITISIISVIYLMVTSINSEIISYSSLLVVSLCHTYMLNKRM